MWRFVVSLCYCVAFLFVVIFVLNPLVAMCTDTLWVRYIFALAFGVIAGTLGAYMGAKTSGRDD